ncbi:conserved hypothetical protein [Thermocrinis albus DSM 14484]|uniref:DUF2231 domain-containing protein n=1 Tax=Thermocrinis albus (strain DSM 14484 / JCM 11386 / HI 11/12) TaxID=638303 RepID=D3SN56_THEAH|nr:DUF2231 domain-containing protein [Thermocrinis albus]ADC90186.1 conserved hypothetical protein [Thermocrinis albus DSM 14484]
MNLWFFALAHEAHAVVQSPPMLQVTYPQVVKIHPPVVHFAIVLPILLFLIEVYKLLRGEEKGGVSLLVSLLMVISVASAALTGWVVHERIESLPITAEAEAVLHLHERLGITLFVFSLLVLTLKVMSLKISRRFFSLLYILGLLLLSGGVLYQGYLGGRLVYQYSVGVPVGGR